MSAPWREVLRWLVGEDLASGGGLDVTLEPTWALPLGSAALVLLAAAFAMAIVYWNETPAAGRGWKALLAALRVTLIAIVALMLYGWTIQRHRTDKPDVVILVDDSASMDLADQEFAGPRAAAVKRRLASLDLAAPTRLNLAKALLLDRDGDLLAELSRRYHVRFYWAGAAARAAGGDGASLAVELAKAQAAEPASRLGNCVREVLEAQRGRPTAAILMLTDGVTTEGTTLQDAARAARRRSIPLFLVGLGSEHRQRDLWLADLQADDAAFVGDWLHFDVRLAATGFAGPATVRLLRRDGDQPLAETTVTLTGDGVPQPVRLSSRADQPGEFEYTVEVAPRENERNIHNNRLTQRVVIREETIRVLLVQAYPSYEFRFLKQTLVRELNANQPEASKTAGVRTVLQEADLAYAETDKSAEATFPASRDELFRYDVLIFGDVNPALLSPSIMKNIEEFVTVRGGGLIFIAGPRYTPLAFRDTPLTPLFPFDLDSVRLPSPDRPLTESFRPRLTPLGLASPMMQLADSPADNERLWRDELPPLRWFINGGVPAPGVRVLAEHPTERDERGTPLPIICLQFRGAGKVVFHATDETHRWRFRSGDLYFARYWVQTIRYLCRAKLLAGDRTAELTTDREEYLRGDAVQLRVRFFDDRSAPAADDGVVVLVERDGGERQSVTLSREAASRGLFTGSAGALPAGEYRAWVSSPALGGRPPAHRFTITAPPGELARKEMDAAELREAARLSLGKFYPVTAADTLVNDLPTGRRVHTEILPPKPIWNAPLVAGLFVLVIATEWLLRKRIGML